MSGQTTEFQLGRQTVGLHRRPYIIAELSANHRQKFDVAMRLVEAAARAGADAVKTQTFTPDTITLDCDRPEFLLQQDSLWKGRRLHELYGEAFMPWEWQPQLKKLADDLGIDFISSPFDFTAVDFLDGFGIAAFKIASFELVDLPLIRHAAAKGKPLILSTGMATEAEIVEAAAEAADSGCAQAVFLKCTSEYPAAASQMHLRAIGRLAEITGCHVGLSDHTLTNTAAIASIALGARVIEKHFTLSRGDGGPDAAFSLEPGEFRSLVDQIHEAFEVLGSERMDVQAEESTNRVHRRSLYVAKDVRKGDLVSPENVRSVRPGYGLHTRHYDEVMGRRFAQDCPVGTPLSWELMASPQHDTRR